MIKPYVLLLLLSTGLTLASCSPTGTNPTGSPAAGGDPDTADTTLSEGPPDTFMAPNVQFTVQAEAGTCPATVGLWELGLGFEGGADHTVVADFPAIADGPTEILHREAQRIVYGAPLRQEFATCSGTAESDWLTMYQFQFGNGQVQFELDVSQDTGFREIRYADSSANRPYIYWRATE